MMWPEHAAPWPQSLFGRLIGALLLAVLVAQSAAIILIAREREHFIQQVNVREWSHRIGEYTTWLQSMDLGERTQAANRLLAARRSQWPARMVADGEPRLLRLDGEPPGRDGVVGQGTGTPPRVRGRAPRPPSPTSPLFFVPVPFPADFDSSLRQALQATLGSAYEVAVTPTSKEDLSAIPVTGPMSAPVQAAARLYDVSVRFPDGYSVVYRLARQPTGAPLSTNLLLNLGLLVVLMVIALYVTARSITRPLSELAHAADRMGRDARQPKLEEKGTRELRAAARAFNTMQDRLLRYLDSRTRVLADMSHDLKTPLTRLRLQVETLEDSAAQARFGKQLDEMERMVHGALALFRGLDNDESLESIDVNEMLATLQSEQAELGGSVTLQGRAARPLTCKPHALRRCLTNLLDNAIKFGGRAHVAVEQDAVLVIRVRDEGPGIPPDELERVFEPLYRLDSSRNRETGGTGLGLSIARDIAQAHGGSLVLRNRPEGGLEALLVLPMKGLKQKRKSPATAA
jgi:signal transduction histidine kinase